jgi:hypothetical protein
MKKMLENEIIGQMDIMMIYGEERMITKRIIGD